MLSTKLFEAGLKTLSQNELRHVVDVVNDWVEKKTIVMTGRVVIDPDGKIIAVDFSTKDKKDRPKKGDNYTCLAFDMAHMGIEKWDEDKKSYTKNFFHGLSESHEMKNYKVLQELEELRAYKRLMEKK